MSRSYSRSRSRSPVARKSRSRSPARRQERSRSREASPEKIMYSIVVSDLPADIRESELERKFEQFGKIGDVFMPKDRYRRVKVTVFRVFTKGRFRLFLSDLLFSIRFLFHPFFTPEKAEVSLLFDFSRRLTRKTALTPSKKSPSTLEVQIAE